MYQHGSEQNIKWLTDNESLVIELARLKSFAPLSDSDVSDDTKKFVSTQIGDFKIFVPTGELENLEEQLERLDKQMKDLEKQIARSRNKLSNEQFLEKAPAAIIEKERSKLSESQKSQSVLLERRNKLVDSQLT